MPRDALKTLFHPFESGALDAPAKHTRALFLNAEAGFRLPEGFEAALTLVQGFRPEVQALETARRTVAPLPEGDGYDHSLILIGRHRGRNELDIAEAIERTLPGGLILVAGGKEDGIASLRKRLGNLLSIDEALPKHHGIVFWFRQTPEAEAAAQTLRSENPEPLVDGRFHTAPGMFSHDRVDQGSRLLAQHLPPEIKGAAADFCAGWGYLAAEIATRAKGLTKLDLYEADFAALEAARRNLAVEGIEPRFFWQDLLKDPVARQYDLIVMNPPYHQGGAAADPAIGQGMIKAASAALKPGGRLLMVANRQLPYLPVLEASFSSATEIGSDGAFRIYAAKR
ncbi:class I SAM-dependent methyltransferase [Oryzicola mucosus]|uniref:Class I SAM-dependent methyltransferase n=1 Tax=Oryzicola mucosus TaxID=2767425 RepID=A0A8J6PT62_9HYPH|nr:class I SAM-dependent methyltransferase [Oryzicola mucosus]MBD0413408.1 class I SAM-dependent methyltransferase [Oryzicola mucosus]